LIVISITLEAAQTATYCKNFNFCNPGSCREAKTKDRQWLWKERWFILRDL